MLSPSIDTFRRFLHLIAACVWVGGQFSLAGLVGTLRGIAPDAPRRAARAFNRVAWPAFGVLLATGVWNVVDVNVADTSTAYQVTLFCKIFVVAISGIAAWVHGSGRGRLALALGGALSALASLGAVFLGLLLSGG